MLIDKIPDQNKAIIGTRCEMTTLAWRPFNAVEWSSMALEFKQSLSWLTNVKDADDT